MSDLKRKIEDFNKRWNIITNDDYSLEFQKFKTRILNILNEVDDKVEDEGIVQFCNLIGKSVKWKQTSQERYSTNIIDAFTSEINEYEFYRLIEYLFIIKFKRPNSLIYNFSSFQENYFDFIKEVIDYSKINVTSARKGADVILFPRGEELLDEKIVNEVLTFLSKGSDEHFISALKFYEEHNCVKSAESLRRALEEFLKYKLKNDRGLNNSIGALQKKMKEDNRDPEIRKIMFQIFNYLDEYFNENSKHKDGDIDEAENEFLIYQTGVLMIYK